MTGHSEDPINDQAILWPTEWPVTERTTRKFLERLFHAIGEPTEAPAIPIDDDTGSLWLRWGGTPFRFLVKQSDPALLVVQAVLAENVDCSLALLKELNVINGGIVSARVFYDQGWVVAQAETVLVGATHADAVHLAWSIGSLADWAAHEIGEQFGGDRYENPMALTVPSSTPRWS